MREILSTISLRPRGVPLACFLLALSTSVFTGLADVGAQEPPKEIYQDFRNHQPLLESLRLIGPDVEGEFKAEHDGLRVTLPAVRQHHWPAEVTTNFPLTGDFEMTGTYEFLAGAQPAKGYGVGVSLIVADDSKRKKFAKVSRLMRAKEGSVHLTEYWSPYQVHFKNSDAKAGQLRLVRVGPSLRYLVSDGPGQAFREIWHQKNFGADDLHYVVYGVSDSGEPGNPVDARLIDLRIRMGTIAPDKALDPAPLAAPAPPPTPAPPIAEMGRPLAKGWLPVMLFLGMGLTLILVVGVAAWLFVRNRGRSVETPATQETDDAPAEPAPGRILVSCPNCGRKLKARIALAGKKIKCTKCGTAVPVPELPGQDDGDAST